MWAYCRTCQLRFRQRCPLSPYTFAERWNRDRQNEHYRLNIVKVDLPPLRKRKEDIPVLVEHFISRFNRRQDKSISGVAPDVMATLMAHDYPGNVRELENIAERAFVLCNLGRIERIHLPSEFTGQLAAISTPVGNTIASQSRAAESQAIRSALERHEFNRLAAARELGLHKSSLFRKIKALGIELPEQDGRSKRKSI